MNFQISNKKSEFDINVLHEVASRPILWDFREAEYRESDKKPAIWLEIAETLQSTPGLYGQFIVLNNQT